MGTSTLISKKFSELREGLPEEYFGPQASGFGDTEAKTEQTLQVLENLKRLLGPMVPALLHDCCGSLDLSKIKATDFEEFKEFLKTQAALNDQKSFRDPYANLLVEERFEPLLKLLFQEIQAQQFVSLPDGEADLLIREFQSRLIQIDADAFARSHLISTKGRNMLRHVLNDRANFNMEQRADLVKAIGRWDRDANPQEDASYGYLIGQTLSLWNYFNWRVTEADVEPATRLALSALDQGNETEKLASAAPRIGDALHLDAAQLERMQKLAKSQSLDPRSEVRARLAELWLTAANTQRFSESHEAEAYSLNRHVMKKTEAFLKRAESLNSDEGLKTFNEDLQEFLGGPLQQAGENGAWAWAKHQAAGGGLDDIFAQQQEETRRPFDRLKQLSDEWEHALDCGQTVLQGPTKLKIDDPKLQASTEALIQALQKTQRQLWYGYKQHRGISRAASNLADLVDAGDKAEIRAASEMLERIISRLSKADGPAAVEAEVRFLYEELKEGGHLYHGFTAAEMEGIEQVLGLAQTTALIAATTYLTRGANVAAIGGMAVVRGAGAANFLRSVVTGWQGLRATAAVAETAEVALVSDRIAKGFVWGAYISTAENAVAASTGEVRPGQEKLGDWVKDAMATGAAMSLTGALPAPHTGESGLLRQLAARYTHGGVRAVGRLGMDVGVEIGEEALDQYGRQALDGKTQALGWSQIEEISKLSALGGFTKVGAVAEAIRGKPAAQAQKYEIDSPEKAPRSGSSSLGLTHPLFSPMWMTMGVDGPGGGGPKKRVPYRENSKENIALSPRGAELLIQLQNGNRDQKIKAAETLAELKELGAVEELQNILNRATEDHHVRVSAAQALGDLNAQEAVDDLKKLLNNRTENEYMLRIRAALVLKQLGSPEGIFGLRNMLSDRSEGHWARIQATQVLVKLNAGKAIDGLRDDLRKILLNRMEEYSMRMNVAEGLFKLGDRQVLDDLRQIIADTSQGYNAKQSAGMRQSAVLFIKRNDPSKLHALAAPALLGADFMLNGEPTATGVLLTSIATLLTLGMSWSRDGSGGKNPQAQAYERALSASQKLADAQDGIEIGKALDALIEALPHLSEEDLDEFLGIKKDAILEAMARVPSALRLSQALKFENLFQSPKGKINEFATELLDQIAPGLEKKDRISLFETFEKYLAYHDSDQEPLACALFGSLIPLLPESLRLEKSLALENKIYETKGDFLPAILALLEVFPELESRERLEMALRLQRYFSASKQSPGSWNILWRGMRHHLEPEQSAAVAIEISRSLPPIIRLIIAAKELRENPMDENTMNYAAALAKDVGAKALLTFAMKHANPELKKIGRYQLSGLPWNWKIFEAYWKSRDPGEFLKNFRIHALAFPAVLGADLMLHGEPTATGVLLSGLAAIASSATMVGILSSVSNWFGNLFGGKSDPPPQDPPPSVINLSETETDTDTTSLNLKFDALDAFLESKNPKNRVKAATRIAKYGWKHKIPELLRLLTDAQQEVRDAAASALAILGDSSLVPELEKLLAHPQSEVRRKAKDLISRLKLKGSL